jgi:ABC-type lipoprotein export system ATPase subunit
MIEHPETLVLEDVVKRYESEAGPVLVLMGVSFTVAPGETVAIVGPSGSGKSTLLNIIGSLDRPSAGRVLLGQTEVTTLDGPALAEFRATKVGFVFQEHHLLPQLTATENALLPALAMGRAEKAQERAKYLLERMGVSHRADAFPAQMSGGERQRVAVARALINAPGLLLCDEPTGNLDRDSARGVCGLLTELSERDGVTVLMVTHNLELAERFSRRLELKGGQLTPAADKTQEA